MLIIKPYSFVSNRNYHVFYYLLAGASEEERLAFHLKQPEEYHYLNQVSVNEKHFQTQGIIKLQILITVFFCLFFFLVLGFPNVVMDINQHFPTCNLNICVMHFSNLKIIITLVCFKGLYMCLLLICETLKENNKLFIGISMLEK